MIGVLLLLSTGPAVALPPGICLTPKMLPPRMGLLPEPMPPPDGGKGLRDYYGVPNALESENFVVRWGNSGHVQTSDVQALLDAFEVAWSTEIGWMGMPAPYGTDAYKFNVYVGDTGDGAPSAAGAAGYYTLDPQGWPMIVIDRTTTADPSYRRSTAAHEFFHALQYASATWNYSGESAWYWEATATWVEPYVVDGNHTYAVFLFGYAYLPYLPVDFFDFPDTGALQEYHQYGAFIFPRYLTEQVGDWSLVTDSWIAPPAGSANPLEALRAELADMGEDLDEQFLEFAAHNATWDYEDGDIYAQVLDSYASYFPGQDARVVAFTSGSGTDGMVDAPAETLPQRYGYNVIELDRPDSGDLHVALELDAQGSQGSEASWGAVLVQSGPGGLTYTDVPITGDAGKLDVPDVGSEEAIYLVVGAWSDRLQSGETFGYRYQLQVGDGVGDPGQGGGDSRGVHAASSLNPGGCACSTGGRRGALGWLAIALVGVRRRR